MLREFVLLILTNVAAMGANEQLFGDEEKRLYNFGLGKRAYSYVSEYKRLPVYNFGLGKRAEGANMYSFGLGKRYENDHFEYDDDDNNENSVSWYSSANAADANIAPAFILEKRAKNYNFGLGKKSAVAPHYSFGLGKRVGQYNFGLGKRQGKYSFGLGKKDRVYSFGLGKRYGHFTANQRDDIDYEDTLQEEKRSPKYSFGLGKRSSYSPYSVPLENQTIREDIESEGEPDNDEESIHSERDVRDTRYAMQLPLKSIVQSNTKQIMQKSRENNKKF